MSTRIPTSASDVSYLEALSAPASADAQTVAGGQRIVATRPAPARTRASHKTERDAAGSQRGLDLELQEGLITPSSYQSMTRNGDSFLANVLATQLFLSESQAAWPQDTPPGVRAGTADGARAIDEAVRLLAEICQYAYTLNIYTRFAPKQV